MGIMATAYIALFAGLSSMPILAKIIIVILSAILGAPWATIAGGLRAYLSIDEVPVTLIMNYIAYYILNYLVRGPWKGKETYGYIRTDLLPQDVWFINLPTITIPGIGEVSINNNSRSYTTINNNIHWAMVSFKKHNNRFKDTYTRVKP